MGVRHGRRGRRYHVAIAGMKGTTVRFTITTALIAVLATTPAFAAKPTGKQCAMARLKVFEIETSLSHADRFMTPEKRDKFFADLDRDKATTIADLAASPAYQSAMKEFVLAATDYAKGAVADDPTEHALVAQARVSALKTRFESASERVKLESELACGK